MMTLMMMTVMLLVVVGGFLVGFCARKDERNVDRKKLLIAQRGVVEKVRVGKEIPDEVLE